MPPISLPAPLRMAMDGWGGGMLTAASRARAQFLARRRSLSSRLRTYRMRLTHSLASCFSQAPHLVEDRSSSVVRRIRYRCL